MYEAEMGAVAGSALTGNVGAFMTGIGDLVDQVSQQVKINNATGGSMMADLDVLAAFYNSLSELHSQLRSKMSTLKGQALSVHDQPAGGHVAGVQAAWKSIAESAGVMQHADSLYGNLLSIDHWVQYYMGAIYDSMKGYAQNEGYAIQAFGKATDAEVPVPTRAGSGHSGAGKATKVASATTDGW